MSKRHAEIAGAGFAGLTAACALAQRGWSVRVHERAERLRTTGAGIYIYENGLRVLEAVGAYAAAVEGAPFAHTREVRDERGPLISVHNWKGSRVFSIVRQNVINALAAAAHDAAVEIVTNSPAIGATPGCCWRRRRRSVRAATVGRSNIGPARAASCIRRAARPISTSR